MIMVKSSKKLGTMKSNCYSSNEYAYTILYVFYIVHALTFVGTISWNIAARAVTTIIATILKGVTISGEVGAVLLGEARTILTCINIIHTQIA